MLNQKGAIQFIVLGILLLGIIGGVFLVTQGNPLKWFTRATTPPIVFKATDGSSLPENLSGIPVSKSSLLRVELTSPLGPPAGGGTSAPVSGPSNRRTVSYKVAEDPGEGLNSAPSKPYTTEPTVFEYGFFVAFDVCSKTQKFLWVEFRASDGSIDRRTAQVEIVGPCPSASGPIGGPVVTPTPTPVAKPDLIISDSSGEGILSMNVIDKNGKLVGQGLPHKFWIKVKNIGQATASSPDSILVNVVITKYNDDSLVGSCLFSFNNLAAGSDLWLNSDLNHVTDCPVLDPGSYYVKGEIDYSNHISESNENNNTFNLDKHLSLNIPPYDSTPTPTPTPIPPTSGGGGGGSSGGGGGGGGGTQPTPAPKIISQVRVAESPANLQTALWKTYTQGIVLSHTFIDSSPGEKFIFVQFADDKGQIIKINGQDYITSSIELIGQAAPTPPAGAPTAGSCKDSCGACTTKDTFGNTTYDTCDTSPCSRSGATATTTFTCYAKDNPNCQGTYYCGSGASGGTYTYPTPPTSGSCTIGKTCSCGDTTIGDTRNPASCSDCNGGWCNGGQCATCSGGGTPSSGSSCVANVTTCSCGDTTKGRTDDPGKCYPECNGGWCRGGICATCKP